MNRKRPTIDDQVHGGDGVFPAAHHPVMIQGAGPGQRGDDREKPAMKLLGARPQDDQHPDQAAAVASQRRTPTFSPRKNNHSAVTNTARRNPVADAFRNRQEPQSRRENSDDNNSATSAHRLQTGTPGFASEQRRTRQHRRNHDQREHQKPDPGISIDGSVARDIFAVTIGDPEEHGRCRISAMRGTAGRPAPRAATGGRLPLGQRQ